MGIVTNEINAKSKGGTELSIGELGSVLPQDLLDKFQIIPSRFRGAEPGKKIIYWAHDLPGDPECDHLKSGGYNQYEKLVFVSNWQMQRFIDHYGIPWRKCVVLPNAIWPVECPQEKDNSEIRLIYHTTPHRGLAILVPVFQELVKHFPEKKLKLDVFSSFAIYGWPERDEPFKPLFDQCREDPNINYHGCAEQSEVRKTLANAHIFAYPSIWAETGCRSLMEAMSAKLVCVHSNYGCLAETAAGWTWMYQYHENPRDHANVFFNALYNAIKAMDNVPESMESRLASQQSYANVFYSWQQRQHEWRGLLESLV